MLLLRITRQCLFSLNHFLSASLKAGHVLSLSYQEEAVNRDRKTSHHHLDKLHESLLKTPSTVYTISIRWNPCLLQCSGGLWQKAPQVRSAYQTTALCPAWCIKANSGWGHVRVRLSKIPLLVKRSLGRNLLNLNHLDGYLSLILTW